MMDFTQACIDVEDAKSDVISAAKSIREIGKRNKDIYEIPAEEFLELQEALTLLEEANEALSKSRINNNS